MIRFCLPWLAALLFSSNSWATTTTQPINAQITRRALVCGLGLAGVAAVGGVTEFARQTWPNQNPETRKLEAREKQRDRMKRVMDGYVAAIPGLATNTFLAVAMDAVAEYSGSLDRAWDAKDPSYLDTIMKANMLLIGKITVAALVPNVGNASMGENAERSILAQPLVSSVEMAVLGPMLEEMIFRLFPATVLGPGWKVGVPSNVLFALAHNFTGDGFSFKKIPVTQFMGGLYYWYLIREKGFDHAVLAHAANNNAYVMGLYFNGRFP